MVNDFLKMWDFASIDFTTYRYEGRIPEFYVTFDGRILQQSRFSITFSPFNELYKSIN